ncbi:MAG TPA: hypothetical protein VLG37_01050 [Candidatus Saccharimonadales bacterium]|nr:hypothetical protein [Candidatus Saccharimonadales bacterium]
MSEIEAPTNFLNSEIPGLIISNDPHDLKGAVLSAQYLHDQNPHLPASKSLLRSVLDIQKIHNKQGRLARSCRVDALVANEQYRALTNPYIERAEVAANLRTAVEVAGRGLGRFLNLANTQSYYRKLLLRPRLEPAELQLAIVCHELFEAMAAEPGGRIYRDPLIMSDLIQRHRRAYWSENYL